MSDTAIAINLAVLVMLNLFALYRLSRHGNCCLKKQPDSQQSIDEQSAKDDESAIAEEERWIQGTELAAHNKEYRALSNDISGSGTEYEKDQWYFKMPDSALKHLEACFDEDERKVYLMKRAIELSIEHFAVEMADDAECARIIEERVFNNPQPSQSIDLEELKERLSKKRGLHNEDE